MDENMKKLLTAERMIVFQDFADSYLRVAEKKKFAEKYPNVEDKYGVLNKEQEALLHDYLVRVYKGFGLDLEKVMAEKGAKPVEGTPLTDFEVKELVRLADEYLVLFGTQVERKEKLFRK
jgi:hypothetical protein